MEIFQQAVYFVQMELKEYPDTSIDQIMFNIIEYFKKAKFPETLEPGIGSENRYEIYHVPGKKSITISSIDLPFLEKVRTLPVQTKLEMMGITVEDLQQEITRVNSDLREKAAELLQKRWRWRMTGELADLSDPSLNEEFFGLKLSKTDLLKKIKRKMFSTAELKTITGFFENKSEVYVNEINL